MNRWLWMASIAVVMATTTGCLRHQTRCGNECQPAGLFGRACGGCGDSCRTGCVPGPIGWQQGGLNYSSHLCPHGGTAGHCSSCGLGIGRGQVLRGLVNGSYSGINELHGPQQAVQGGPQTGAVAYPYYTHRGPRDFLLDNPPSIGR